MTVEVKLKVLRYIIHVRRQQWKASRPRRGLDNVLGQRNEDRGILVPVMHQRGMLTGLDTIITVVRSALLDSGLSVPV